MCYFLLTLAYLLCQVFGASVIHPELPSDFDVKEDAVTLSGLSSGAGFAEILHLSHSSIFSGIGIFAIQFYRCGGISKTTNENDLKCGQLGRKYGIPLYSVNESIGVLKHYETKEMVDSLLNLRNQRVYIWMGTQDEFLTTDACLQVINIYEPHLARPDQIHTQIQQAMHHLPTLKFGAKCSERTVVRRDFYCGACNYYGAYEMLRFLLGRSIELERPQDDKSVKVQRLYLVNQTEFFHGISEPISMDEYAYIYVPSGYVTTKDQTFLHIHFHGCEISRSSVGSNYIEHSGFLEVAELNNIIILFPQAKVTEENPFGCWDYFGYTGPDYASQKGPQVRVVRRMLKKLFGI